VNEKKLGNFFTQIMQGTVRLGKIKDLLFTIVEIIEHGSVVFHVVAFFRF
jgi:hypothetical protein